MTENDDATQPTGDAEDTTPSGGSSPRDVRAAKRARREAERAARAQRKAEAARERAVEAARAGGLFEGMETVSPDRQAGSATVRTGTGTASGTGGHTDSDSADGGNTDPVCADGGDTDVARSAAGTPSAREPMDPKRRRRIMSLLSVASVLLVVVAGLATWRYIEAREDTAAARAVANAPQAATDAARQIATEMFTYDHRTVDEDLAAVRDRLTDPALSEFVENSMPTVSSAAKQQQATVYATVAAAAPQEVVDSNHVTVLVMLNRMVSTKEAPEAASSASRLSMQMVREDGAWKLSELNAL